MSKQWKFAFLFCVCSITLQAQYTPDRETPLDSIVVTSFESNRSVKDLPAAIQRISKTNIERFDNQDFVQVLNQFPGLRLEERSPGSYRVAIRGSSLRSPFGVRNVKVYWNHIPLSDGNGSTYFNLQDVNNVSSLEVIKGPAGSIYGAGIGGVLLFNSKTAEVNYGNKSELKINSLVGSYGTFNRNIAYRHASNKLNTSFSYTGTSSQGYRNHSQLSRNQFNLENTFFFKNHLSLNFISQYTLLDYETPLGLTFELKNQDPSQSRPGNRFVGGAEEQDAGIMQEMFLVGLTQEWSPSSRYNSKLSLFGNSTNLQNPFITNYENRLQSTIGIRWTNDLQVKQGDWNSSLQFGFEWQNTNSEFQVFDNNGGLKGDARFTEEVAAQQGFFFIQSINTLPAGFTLQLGLSVNNQNYDYERFNPQGERELITDYSPGIPLIPRLGISKKIGPVNVYAAASQGFSAPTVAEYIDSFDPLNPTVVPLDAETATNIELGLKGNFLRQKGYFELNYYSQNLTNAIVRGFNSAEDQIFTNEGEISQQGLEFYSEATLANGLKVYAAANGSFYFFGDYIDGDSDFTGNRVPSVPVFQSNLGLDYIHTKGFFINSNTAYTSGVYLNNANTAQAEPFWLMNWRAGWAKAKSTWKLKLFAGINNMLNASYGAGNDVNAFGNRFFNPSPPRNFNTGIDLSLYF